MLGVTRPRRGTTAWSPNEIVCYRVARARQLRGWTQDEAARRLEPFIGGRLSRASFSAIERAFRGGRVRQFTADDLVALARCFQLPIGWFLTPPPRYEDITIRTPDDPKNGLDPLALIDLVLGTPETREQWAVTLVEWSQPSSTLARLAGDGTSSADDPKIPERLDELVRVRTRLRLAELFGDTDEARRVLSAIADALVAVESEPMPPTETNDKASLSRKQKVSR